jgi:hypothetical protein
MSESPIGRISRHVSSCRRAAQIYFTLSRFLRSSTQTLVLRIPELPNADIPIQSPSRNSRSATLRVRFKPRVILDRSNGCRLFRPRSDGSDLSLHCVVPKLPGHEFTVQILSRTLGIYDPDFFATREDKGKRVKAFNALVYSFDLTVVNDRRSPDRISSVDQYLFFESSRDSATSAPLQSLCTQSATSSELLKKGVSMGRFIQGITRDG